MKEKIIYISETGRFFENKEDCIKEDYEYYITELYELNTIFFDKDCKQIQKEILMQNEELCLYIYISNLEAINIIKEMYHQIEDTIILVDDTNRIGLYEYSLYCKKYVSTTRKIKYVKKLMKMIDFAEGR